MKISFDMPPATPDSSNDLSVRYAASRRHVPRWRWYLIVLAVLALPVYYGIQFIHDLLVVSAPGFVQMQQVTITAGTAGHVLFVLPSGATVKSGEALCRIQPYEQNDTIAASRSNRISKSALRSLQTALNLQARVVVIRQNKVKALKKLLDEGAATTADLTEAQEQLLSAESSADQSKAALERLAAQTSVLPQVTEASRAPFTGQVIRPLVYPGQWVSHDTPILTLLSHSQPWIEAFLSPKDIRYAHPGTPATIIFSNGQHIPGVVMSVSAEASRLPPQFSVFSSTRGNTLRIKLRLKYPLQLHDVVKDMPVKVNFQAWP